MTTRALLLTASLSAVAGFGAASMMSSRRPLPSSAQAISPCQDMTALRAQLDAMELRLRHALTTARVADRPAAREASATPIVATSANTHGAPATGEGRAAPEPELAPLPNALAGTKVTQARAVSEATLRRAVGRGAWTEADREAWRESWDLLEEADRQTYFAELMDAVAEGALRVDVRGSLL